MSEITAITLKTRDQFTEYLDQFLRMEPTTILVTTIVVSLVLGVLAELAYDRMIKAYRRFKRRNEIRMYEEGSKYPSENDWR